MQSLRIIQLDYQTLVTRYKSLDADNLATKATLHELQKTKKKASKTVAHSIEQRIRWGGASFLLNHELLISERDLNTPRSTQHIDIYSPQRYSNPDSQSLHEVEELHRHISSRELSHILADPKTSPMLVKEVSLRILFFAKYQTIYYPHTRLSSFISITKNAPRHSRVYANMVTRFSPVSISPNQMKSSASPTTQTTRYNSRPWLLFCFRAIGKLLSFYSRLSS